MSIAKKKRKKSVRPTAKASKKEASGTELPVDYALRVMRDDGAEESRRDTMAKAALPYLHAKPKAGDTAARDEAERKKMEEASERLRQKLGLAQPEES